MGGFRATENVVQTLELVLQVVGHFFGLLAVMHPDVAVFRQFLNPSDQHPDLIVLVGDGDRLVLAQRDLGRVNARASSTSFHDLTLGRS
jgi:hypothetical protein